jgi:hypothetical protein
MAFFFDRALQFGLRHTSMGGLMAGKLCEYRRKERTHTTADRLDLDTDGFTYQKNRESRSVVDNHGDVYTVDVNTLAYTYSEISPGVYEKTAYGPDRRRDGAPYSPPARSHENPGSSDPRPEGKVELLIEIGNRQLGTLECPCERIPAASGKGFVLNRNLGRRPLCGISVSKCL